MDVSDGNVAGAHSANGIEALSSLEIEMVSGGKSVVPTKTFWEKLWDWITGGGAPPTEPATPQVRPVELPDLMQACIEAGGSFTISTGPSTSTIALADENGLTVKFECIMP